MLSDQHLKQIYCWKTARQWSVLRDGIIVNLITINTATEHLTETGKVQFLQTILAKVSKSSRKNVQGYFRNVQIISLQAHSILYFMRKSIQTVSLS